MSSDMEKTVPMGEKYDPEAAITHTESPQDGEVEVIKAKHIQESNKILRTMRQGEEWLDAKMGVETKGIDRITEEEKQPPSIWNVSLDSNAFCQRKELIIL
jgi:hypothetical protein